jgi:uncharacterized coiled-coil DUF342 family protein
MSIEVAKTHYFALRKYLASHLLKEQTDGISLQRQSARDKLVRLTQQQFQELSTDVYDELTRRLLNSPTVPFLPLKDEYHPKRNQARQKLATLPKTRFKDLASDVYAELDRRYPQFNKEWIAKYEPQTSLTKSPPTSRGPPATSVSPLGPPRKAPAPPGKSSVTHETHHHDSPTYELYNEIIPDKGQAFMSADDHIEYTVVTNRTSHGGDSTISASLDVLMSDLGGVMKRPGDATDADYLKTIHSLRAQIRDLEDRLVHGQGLDESSVVSDLHARLKEQQRVNWELEDRTRKLEQENQGLQSQLASQQRAATNVTQETSGLLETVQHLTQQNEQLADWKESAQMKIRNLQEEIMALRNQMGKHTANVFSEPGLMDPIENGWLPHDRVSAYQNATQTLVSSARNDGASELLIAVKSVVVAIREITGDLEECQRHPEQALVDAEELDAIHDNLSGSLAALVSAVKSYASYMDSASLPSIESALARLDDAVVEVVRALRIQSSSRTASFLSKLGPSDRKEIEEVRAYLEQRTDAIVQAIQALVNTMRAPTADVEEVAETVEAINDIVHNIIKVFRKTTMRIHDLHEPAAKILSNLETSNEQLMELREELPSEGMMRTNGNPGKQELASVSFEIAKFTKELLALIE